MSALFVYVKLGVRGRLNPETQKCVGRIFKQCYRPRGLNLMITSICEGTHDSGSLHYCGDAVDFQGQDVPLDEIARAAGAGFDVVPSMAGAIHVEWDPKP